MLCEFWTLGPLATFIGLLGFELSRRNCFVDALLRAVVWWVLVGWILSNGLGVFSALNPIVLRASWTALGVGSLIAGGWRFKQTRRPYHLSWPRLQGWEWGFATAGAILVGLALVTAIYSPPVTVDVLNYHLPRQLMWLQQGSLEHFITINDRALMMPPLAEVIGLQFLALTGGDHWVNFPQWMAYALMPLVVGKIARGLGMSRLGALLAGWLVLCLPMAYHEASNAKNDLQGAFWVALLAWRVVEAMQKRKVAPWDAILVGIVLAMALLTKSTAFLYAPSLIVVGWVAWYRQGGRQESIQRALLAAGVCLVLVTPFFAQNVAWYGTPLGTHRAEDGGQQANSAVTPALIASNLIRNAAVHLAMPSKSWNEGLERGVAALHRGLGLSIQDRRNTLWILDFAIEYKPREETGTTAPIHFLAILVSLGWALSFGRAREWRWLAYSVLSMGFLFCVVLKWQPWGARLELPIFVLGSVVVAGTVDSATCRWRSIGLLLLAALGLTSWWPGREESSRPLWTEPTIFDIPREVNMYRYLPFLRERDESLARLIKESGVQEVAVVTIHDIPYPLMQKLQMAVPDIHFYGAPVSDGAEPAEAYVRLGLLEPLPLTYAVAGEGEYRLVGAGPGDGIYLTEGKVMELGWQHQLPDFAGWIRSENLQLGVDMPTLSGPARWVRYFPEGSGGIDFYAPNDSMYLTAVVLNSGDDEDRLWFEVNGVVVGEMRLDLPAGEYRMEMVLPTSVGMNRLVIRRSGDNQREVSFTRLVINDVPPVSQSMDRPRRAPGRLE